MPRTAAKGNETANVSQESQTVKEKKTAVSEKAATYTAAELIEASVSALQVPRECASAAFKLQKAERYTLAEAKNIVEKFMKKEVK